MIHFSSIHSFDGATRCNSSISSSAEAVAVEDEVLVLLRVGHAPGTVGARDEAVLLAHDLLGDLLRRVEAVLDHLEHHAVGGQREHRHDHALDAGRDHAQILARLHVADHVAVELGLAVLVEADRVVEFRDALLRHQREQEAHVARGDRRIDHEVGARETEDDAGAILVVDHRVDVDAALLVVEAGQYHRNHAAGVAHAPHEVRGLVAVEHRLQHLDAKPLQRAVQPGQQLLLQQVHDGRRRRAACPPRAP